MPFSSESGATRWDQATALAMLIGGISSFQIGAALAKGLFPLFGPTGMVGLRVGLAAIILLVVWRPKIMDLRPGTWRLLLPYGASMTLMNFAFYIALTRLPLGLVVALEFMGPLSLALVGSRRALDLFWAVLVITGVFLLLRPEGKLGHLDPLGVAAALSSGVGWIVYILTGTRLGRSMPATMATTLGMTTASVFLLPCLIPALPLAVYHPHQGFLALGVAVLSSAVPYILDMMAMRRLKPRELGVLLSLEPMLGAVSGLLFLGEALSLGRWIGVICVVAASAGNVLTSRRPPAETQVTPPG
ncbi:EamA family transporter [Kozakia baliensis]|uniref:Permease n=1 Tax=Kozakia baliensis TaxID=153496 RepID=A0A1D8UVP3_9PROT|nr:DMT family transporter [Kozakia baliensis]AOX17688.1 permease [Kozakia baliensis]GBR31530.1 transporter EamA [Kozakia baliensis NRIC 0488]GEL62804.1 threonine transporter RhtB [Kozakia baliensis]